MTNNIKKTFRALAIISHRNHETLETFVSYFPYTYKPLAYDAYKYVKSLGRY